MLFNHTSHQTLCPNDSCGQLHSYHCYIPNMNYLVSCAF